MPDADPIRAAFEEAQATQGAFLASEAAMNGVHRFADHAEKTLTRGGRILACGNGGSMCDAMHFAEEWTGRFRGDRRALPALALSDPAQLTCIGNDYGFEEVFARQIEAQGNKGDLLVLLSTSGNSPNGVRAIAAARTRGLFSVALLGRGGGKMRELVDLAIVVPHAQTSDRIQEVHIQILHAVIEAVERKLFPDHYR